jgi:hypothetical protein
MSYLLSHLFLLGLLALALWLPGYALERALLRHCDLGALRPIARAALGAALATWALFALAAVGALVPSALAGLATAGGLAALAARLRWPATASAWERPDRLFLALLALFLLPYLLLALTPFVSWDASVYHLTLPKRYLAAGGFVPVELNVYASWPLGTELLYAAALSLGDQAVAKGLHWLFGALTAIAVFAGCRAFDRRAAGWIAAPLLLMNPVFLFELQVAYVDLAYAFFLTCAVLFALRALEADEARSLLLAGLCAGTLCGIKINGVLGAAAAGAVLVPQAVSAARRGDLTPLRRAALCFALPAIALWLPWLVRSALLTGNPVYPLLYGTFGGPDWSEALAVQFDHWQRSIGMGRGPADYLALPVRVILEGGPGYDHFQGRIGPAWIVLVPLSLLALRLRLVRVCLGVSAAYFALWSMGSQQMRFLIPVLPLLAIAAGTAGADLAQRLDARPARRAAEIAAAVAAAVLALVAAAPHLQQALSVLPHFGEDAAALRRLAVHPIYEVVARELSDDARLLLLQTNRGFFLERDYLADSFFEASQIADWLRSADSPEGVHERLAARHLTHVLRERRERGVRWPPALEALLDDPARATLIHRSADGRFELYRLL